MLSIRYFVENKRTLSASVQNNRVGDNDAPLGGFIILPKLLSLFFFLLLAHICNSF